MTIRLGDKVKLTQEYKDYLKRIALSSSCDGNLFLINYLSNYGEAVGVIVDLDVDSTLEDDFKESALVCWPSGSNHWHFTSDLKEIQK